MTYLSLNTLKVRDLIAKYPAVFKGKEPVCGIECGVGWYGILDRLFAALSKDASDLVVEQVKEKFGGLRVYVSGCTDEQYALIDAAESRSFRTCEQCGAPGVRRSGGWIRTLCDEHANDRPAFTT